MMKTTRWCYYILLILIIFTIVWFQLPITFTMESTRRHPVDSTAFQLRVYNGSKQNVVSNTSKQNMVSCTCQQNVVSNTSKQNVVSNTSKQNMVSSTSKQNVVSNTSKQKPNWERIKDKYLVYLCDEKTKCGGWGDRQRGMVSLFLLSLVWKLKFKIELTSPCDIKPFFKPTTEYNWILTEEELKGKIIKSIDLNGINEPLVNMNMNSSEIPDVLYIRTKCVQLLKIVKKYAKFLPRYLQSKGRAGIFRESWSRFMIPTDRLRSQVVTIRARGAINLDAKQSGKELVCAHLRINHYLGFPLAAVPKVWDFIDEHFPNTSRIFVATDHLDVRKSAISKYGRRYIGSYASTMNPDKTRSNLTLACSSQESAYVDQLMLSKCDVLIYSRHSGFSIHASYLKTQWTNIYSILRNSNSTFSLKKTYHH